MGVLRNFLESTLNEMVYPFIRRVNAFVFIYGSSYLVTQQGFTGNHILFIFSHLSLSFVHKVYIHVYMYIHLMKITYCIMYLYVMKQKKEKEE